MDTRMDALSLQYAAGFAKRPSTQEAAQASPVTTTVNSTSPTWNTQRRAGGDYHPQALVDALMTH
jgi:hypothetical protein